jgi:hypothetical protein
VLLVLVGACSEKAPESAPAPAPGSASQTAPAPADAAVVPSDGITAIGTFDPDSGMHLDDEAPPATPPIAGGGPPFSPPGQPPATPPRPGSHGKPIDVVLKSSPPGAMAAVDGVQIGPTPTYWSNGAADGREHEFTFVLRGFAAARYRFVPVASGVIHARLEAIADDRPADGGTAPR